MSTTTKNTSMKGVRYTDAQKKEVIDFALSYNAANGRGGQSKAAEKFKISQLTVATWLKAAGAPAPKSGSAIKAPKAAKVAKAAAAPKAAKVAKVAKSAKAPKAASAPKTPGLSKLGSRYTDDQKKALTDFVVSYNAENGRGGSSTAAKKFGVSPLTVIAWLKAAGVQGSSNKVANKVAKKASKAAPTKAAKAAKSTSKVAGASSDGRSAKLSSLLALSGQIDKAEAEVARLKGQFSSLKASL